MSTKDFYENYYRLSGSEIPTVPHTLESPFTSKDRLISKRGAVCACAAAVACLGGGVGFGSLIPKEDHMPLVLQLQEEITQLEQTNKKLDTSLKHKTWNYLKENLKVQELESEVDQLEQTNKELNSSLKHKTGNYLKENLKVQNLEDELRQLTNESQALTQQIDSQIAQIQQLKKDNETRKDFIVTQNEEILKLQKEKESLTLQVDKEIEKNTNLNRAIDEILDDKDIDLIFPEKAEQIEKKIKERLCKRYKFIGIFRKYNNELKEDKCLSTDEEKL